MEAADIIVLNKSDEVDLAVLTRARNDLRQALHLTHPRFHGRIAKVLTCSALLGKGLSELIAHIDVLHADRLAAGLWQQRRSEQLREWVWASAEEQLLNQFRKELSMDPVRTGLEVDVTYGRTSPAAAARCLVDRFRTSGAPPREEQ